MHDCWCKFNTIANAPKNAPLPQILQFCDCTLYFFLEQNTSRCHFFSVAFFWSPRDENTVPRKCVRAKKSVCAVGEISIVLAEWVRVGSRFWLFVRAARQSPRSVRARHGARARGTILGNCFLPPLSRFLSPFNFLVTPEKFSIWPAREMSAGCGRRSKTRASLRSFGVCMSFSRPLLIHHPF